MHDSEKMNLFYFMATQSPFIKSKCKKTITITYGEVCENHAGMQKIGKLADHGISILNLKAIQQHFHDLKYVTELIDLVEAGGITPVESLDAMILIVRGGVQAFCNADELYEEQCNLPQDTLAFKRWCSEHYLNFFTLALLL